MNKETDSNQAINQYLLGLLPEAEAERLDEQSFTDDEFADALRVAEKDLVDAYMQGELTGQTLEHFRAHYLSSPTRRERVNLAQAFQSFLEKNAAADAKTLAEATIDPEVRQRRWRWSEAPGFFVGQRSALQWVAVSAVLVLLISGGWLFVDNLRLRKQLGHTRLGGGALAEREAGLLKELEGQRSAKAQAEEELARVRGERERLEQESKHNEAPGLNASEKRAGSISIASFVLAPQMRSGGKVSAISVPTNTDEVEVQLRLEPNDFSAYRVALLNLPSNQTIWRSGTLKARTTGPSKTVSVRLRADLLKPQMFIMQVSGVSANGASEVVGDYPFKVVRP